ncbi:glutamate-1-semialdehyde 2-1-aminomutase chloroplastic-like [Brachionus plicatilis]|uniref:Glutamate-1-semialdehyde 2-1-aminomutase chloroplastic-like n=1 Tax=Brachionus plicatilis TaxID=10195 RepID=A0A3M7TAW7_BRAPC|nr:glutamate-1-semialdehyde 2-1-aminomutase chloroplastic-like [Brachionus plicatilis]
MSVVRDCFLISTDPIRSMASVAMAVRGHKAFTAMPSSLSSSLIPSTQKLIPYLAIVLRGGERFKMCGLELLRKYGMAIFEHKNVPLAFTWFIRSYFFIVVSKVPVRLIADALLTKMSIPPNFLAPSSSALATWSSNLTSTMHGNAWPPTSSISLAAV